MQKLESSGAEVRKYCRCFKMLQNEYFLTCKIGFDTAANESSKVVRHLSSLFETFFVTLNLICTESPHPTAVLLTLGVGCGRAEPQVQDTYVRIVYIRSLRMYVSFDVDPPPGWGRSRREVALRSSKQSSARRWA